MLIKVTDIDQSDRNSLTRQTELRKSLVLSIQWRHNERNGVSNHQPHDCLLQAFRSKKTPKLRVTGLCGGNSPVTDEFLAQRASNAENVSIWWRHHDCGVFGRSKWSPKYVGYHIGEHGLEEGSWITRSSTQLYKTPSLNKFQTVFSCDQAALWMVQSVCLSVCLWRLFHYIPIIVSS